MRIYLFTIITLLFVACNPVKKVIKDTDMTRAVVDHYLLTNPIKNDTVTTYKSDTIMTVISKSDTVLSDPDTVNVLTPRKVKTIFTTNTVTRTLHDTVRVTIVDKSFQVALQQQNLVLNAQLTAETISRDKAAHSRNWWIGAFFSLVAAITVYFCRGIIFPAIGRIFSK